MNTMTNKIRALVIKTVLGAVCPVPVAMGGDLPIPETWVAKTLTEADLNGNC